MTSNDSHHTGDRQERNYQVLISCPLIFDDISEYEAELMTHGISYDIADVDQQLGEDDLLELLPTYDGILAGDDELTRNVIASAPNLEVISKWGIGTDNIDFEAAEDHGVEVYNTPGVFNDEVADVVIGYAIMLTRELHRIDHAVRNGDWHCPRGTSLAGKTIGVVGVGNIGAAVARRAYALGMTVLGTDIEPFPGELESEIEIERVDSDDLLARSDIVSLNCALTEATREMIGSDELALLGEDGYLINTARGQLIDQEALVSAIEDGLIAGAALDVFTEEPLHPEHPLTEFESVILGSHNAQNTTEAVNRVHGRAVGNLINGLTQP